MKIKELLVYIILVPVLVVLLIVLINPFNIFMGNNFLMMLLLIILIVSFIILIFFWLENPRDEREADHINKASRFALFSSSIILIIAITFQTFNHNLDPWIPIVLGVIVSSKAIAILYSRIKK